jgi:HSP20 family protein
LSSFFFFFFFFFVLFWFFDVRVPRAQASDVKVQVTQGNVLRITGERKEDREETSGTMFRRERSYGSFERAFKLPANADAKGIAAETKDGVLVVSIPKVAPEEPKTHVVEVKQADTGAGNGPA